MYPSQSNQFVNNVDWILPKIVPGFWDSLDIVSQEITLTVWINILYIILVYIFQCHMMSHAIFYSHPKRLFNSCAPWRDTTTHCWLPLRRLWWWLTVALKRKKKYWYCIVWHVILWYYTVPYHTNHFCLVNCGTLILNTLLFPSRAWISADVFHFFFCYWIRKN